MNEVVKNQVQPVWRDTLLAAVSKLTFLFAAGHGPGEQSREADSYQGKEEGEDEDCQGCCQEHCLQEGQEKQEERRELWSTRAVSR